MNLKKGLKRRTTSAAIDLTPLIDVVFNLLIFLLVSTTFKSQEQAFQIELPVGDHQSTVAKVKRPTVYVGRDGRYIFYTPDEDSNEPVAGRPFLSLDSLSRELERFSKDRGKNVSISIKGDQKTEYQRILDVVNECQKYGIERVFFPYTKEGGFQGP